VIPAWLSSTPSLKYLCTAGGWEFLDVHLSLYCWLALTELAAFLPCCHSSVTLSGLSKRKHQSVNWDEEGVDGSQKDCLTIQWVKVYLKSSQTQTAAQLQIYHFSTTDTMVLCRIGRHFGTKIILPWIEVSTIIVVKKKPCLQKITKADCISGGFKRHYFIIAEYSRFLITFRWLGFTTKCFRPAFSLLESAVHRGRWCNLWWCYPSIQPVNSCMTHPIRRHEPVVSEFQPRIHTLHRSHMWRSSLLDYMCYPADCSVLGPLILGPVLAE